MAKSASEFWIVGPVLELFIAKGCEVRIAEATVHLEDGDCLNVRYLLNPTNNAFVPLVDLTDNERVSEAEVAFWERRLGIDIGRPRLH